MSGKFPKFRERWEVAGDIRMSWNSDVIVALWAACLLHNLDGFFSIICDSAVWHVQHLGAGPTGRQWPLSFLGSTNFLSSIYYHDTKFIQTRVLNKA